MWREETIHQPTISVFSAKYSLISQLTERDTYRHTHTLKDTHTLRVSHAHSEREKNTHTLRETYTVRERHRY